MSGDAERVACEWLVRSHYLDPRACGRDAVARPDGVSVCWQHEDLLIRAGIDALRSDRFDEHMLWEVERALASYVARLAARASDRRRLGRRLGEVVSTVMRECAERGVDLGLPSTVDDLVEDRLRNFMEVSR